MANLHQYRTYDTRRLEALSDGIFAFSMTLLILNFAIPEIPKNLAPHELWPKLSQSIPDLFDFILSFMLLAIFWNSHQRIFEDIEKTNQKITWVNILLLLLIIFLPFSTELMSMYGNSSLAVSIFSTNLLLINLSAIWIWHYAKKEKFTKIDLSAKSITYIKTKNNIILIITILALITGFFVPNYCTLFYLLIPLSFIFIKNKE